MTDRSLPSAVTATDLLLRAILDELRGLRADMDGAPVMWRQRIDKIADDVAAVQDGETIELREPEMVYVTPIGGGPETVAIPSPAPKAKRR